jgi:hypothetical protein
MPEPVNVPLTEAEANALLGLIDIAVKAAGLQIAATALSLAEKLQAPFQPQTEDATHG